MANVLKSLSLCSSLVFSTMLVSCGVSGGVLKNLNLTEEKMTKSNQGDGNVAGGKKNKVNPVVADPVMVDPVVVDPVVLDPVVLDPVVDDTVIVDPAPDLTPASYALVQKTFETKCVICHATKIPIMKGLADIKPRRAIIISHLDLSTPGTKMPMGPEPMPGVSAAKAFADSSEGKKFFEWIKGKDATVVVLPKPDGVPKLADYNSTMKAIIDANCARCHKAGGEAAFAPLSTFDQVFNARDPMAETMGRARMPEDNTGWAKTTQGKKLLDWLKTGAL